MTTPELLRYYRDRHAHLTTDIEQYQKIDTSAFPPGEKLIYQDNLTKMRKHVEIIHWTINALSESR